MPQWQLEMDEYKKLYLKGHLYDSGHFVDIYISILNDINGDYAD